MKLNQSDFTKICLKKEHFPGGSVAKAKLNINANGSTANGVQIQSEAFNGLVPPADKLLETGGAITNGAQPISKVDLGAPNPAVGTGIKTEDVIAGILVIGVIVATVVIIVKIKNSRNKKNEHPKTK